MMLARSSWLLLLSRAGLLLASVQSDCGGVLLPSVTSRILQYDLLVSDSINGTKCSWILQAPSSQTVELDVISYQTVSQTDTSCTSAYLAIKLGPTQKEKRFCQPFWSIPEIGRKLVIRGKGPGVVTLRSAYGMKQGFTLRYLVLVPDANHREIETRAKELRTLIPLVSSVKGEGEQVYLSKGETVTFSTATGKEQQSISDYPSMSTMWKRQRPPWTHQSSWSPRHSKLLVHPSDQRRTRFPLQPGEVPAREDSHSDFSTIFDSKSLRTHTSTERSKSSLGPEMLKVAPSDSKSSLQLYLTSILSSPSSLISPSPSLSEPTSPTPSPSPSSLTSPSSPTSLSISTTSSPSPSTSLTPSGSTSPTPSNLIFLSPSGLTSPLPSSLTSPSAFSSSLISLSPSGPTSSTSSPTSSPSDPSFPTSSRTNSVSTLVLNSKSNLNSTLSLSASFPSSLLLPENTTMIDNVPLMSLKNALAPSSAVPDKGQGDVMSQSESKPSRQSMLELSESAWGVFPGSQQNSSSGQELHSTWSAESTQINNGEDYVDTRGDVNMHLLNTSPGELQSLLQISGDVVSSISPKTNQTSITQSTPPSQTMAFKISSVTVAIPGDELSQDKCKCNHSDTHGITRSADHGMELETRPQSWDDMEVPVTLTPARDPSPDLSILTEEGVVEMSPGGGSVSRVERSSTASAKVWTESREQNALPGFPASSSELITPQLEQDRKQESESDQHMLFLSQITDIPTSESLSVNTQDLVDSFRIDSVAETVNQSEATHWMLDFKDVSSDFGGTITPALSQVMIKSTSSSWSMFEFPELMTHSSSLPVQEVTNGAEIDTATLSYESRPSDSAHLSEILPTVASLSDAVTTQGARSQFPVTDENALTTQGVSFNNRIPSSVSFSPGTTLPSISDGNGGEMVSVQETGDSFDTTGPGSEIVSTRDIPVENGVNVTVFTITKNRTTEAMTTHSQRLEVTPNAKSSSGFSVLFDFSGTEKDGNRTNALLDSTTEMLFTTEPSGKTDWFEQGTSSPSNSGRKNMDGFPTKGNVVSDDSIPSFSPRTFAPEPITPQSPVNISPPSVEVNHSASPPKEIFPTTLPFTWMPERSSTRLQGSLPLTRSRGIILPTSSKTTMLRSNNPESSSGRTVESPTPAGERFRKTSTPIMNQTFQEVSRPLVASGISSFTPGSLDQTRPDTRRPTPSSLPVLTHPVVSVTNLAQFLPSVSTFETASQPFTDQKGSRSSQTVGSSPETSVSDSGEPAWSTTVHLKFTVPLPPAFPSVEEEGKIVTSEEPPLSSTLQLNQLGSQSNDDLPGPNVTHVDTKKLSNNPSQSTQPGRNKQWQREILSTLVAAHTASSEGFWTWGQSDLGTLPTSHGVVPTLASSVSPEGTRSLPTGAMITKSLITPSIPNTPASGRDNSWMPGRDDTSLGSPTPAMGILTSLLPTSQQLHSHVNTTSSGKTLQITMHQPTSGTHWEVMNSVSSFTPTEKLKHIFIVGNKLPMIKEDATVKIPTKLILDMNFTLQLADSTSEKYQNLVVDFTNKVSPFYKNVPGFQQLQVKRFSSGSVLIDFDVIFIAKEIRSYLLDPRLIFNITGLYDAISGGFEIDGAQVLGAYISESFIALCGEVFSCQTGFQCIHSNTGNVSCTSLCHTDYCKNSGICTHNVGQGPVCQCPVGIDYWFMGPRCDYRMTRQSLIGIAFAVVLSLLLVMGAVAIVVLRRFKILLIEAKVDQTKSSYKRFSRFDDFSNQYQSHPWLNYSVSSLDNPGFSNSDELIHLQMLDSSYYSCHEESVTGTYSSWRTTPHDRSTFRHSLQNNLDFSISSINEHAGDSGKASDLSVYSWPIEPLQWSPFPILYQLNRDRPFKARRPRSYCEGMELVSMERNWTA